MKPFATLGLCLALLAAPAFAQGQPPKSPELLARLKAAIPPDNGPEVGAEDADEVRRTLGPLNPGREQEVEALAISRFNCHNALMNKPKILDILVASADQRLTQTQIEQLIAFYEGPDYKALVALEGLPDSDPAMVAANQKLMADPTFVSFVAAMRDGMTDYMRKPGVMEAVMACETNYAEALRKSGLKQP